VRFAGPAETRSTDAGSWYQCDHQQQCKCITGEVLSTCLCQCKVILGPRRPSWHSHGDDKIIRRPSMTSPQAFRGASCPFLQQLTHHSLCSRSRCLLIPRRLERRRKECSRPRASEPCPEKQKRGSSCPQAPHRSCQLQLRACRLFPRRQITGCTADAASCWAGKRWKGAEERPSVEVRGWRKEKVCSRLMQRAI